MANRIYTVAILMFLLFILARQGLAEPSTSTGWSQRMQSLYRTLSALLVDVSSDERFDDPKRKDEIQAEAERIASLAHDLAHKRVTSPDHDPSVTLFAGLFAEETQYAVRLLQAGHTTYPREILRAIPGYCIACHTRNSSGPHLDGLTFDTAQLKGLSSTERGELFAASRQYDRALDELGTAISDADAPSRHPVNWIRAVKDSLAIAVRVRQDPDLAAGLVERVIQARNAPLSIKEDAVRWRASLAAWKTEPRRQAITEEGLHSEAMRLLAEAHDIQKYPSDRGADIVYLRATAVLHDLLSRYPSSRHAAEAYLMLGISYEVLRSFNLEEVHELYYEACIRTAPHSPVALSCYHRYEESVYEGFTGSLGTDLPDDVVAKLKTLRELATPAPADAKEVSVR